MMNVSAEGHLTQPQEQEMASLRTELAKEQTAMAGMYAVQTDHLGQLQTMVDRCVRGFYVRN